MGKAINITSRCFKKGKVYFAQQMQVIADKGVSGYQKLHANSVIPVKAKRGGELSTFEKV